MKQTGSSAVLVGHRLTTLLVLARVQGGLACFMQLLGVMRVGGRQLD
jgi:hypothetical protein